MKIAQVWWNLRSHFGLTRRYYGLNQLDRKLERWLDFDGGVFIEAGANNGLSQSNTCHFERFRGWTGLLIEPIPEKAALCRLNRPNSVVVNCALGAPEQEGTELSLTYCNLMTVADGGQLSGDDLAQHIAVGSEIQKLEPYGFTAPCSTLSAQIDAHSLDRIDFLSLDVEGYEVPVLRGLDLTRHRPRFLLVEARDEEGIRSILAPYYDEVATLSHHDALFVAKSVS